MDEIEKHGLKLIDVMKAAGLGAGQVIRRETIDAVWSAAGAKRDDLAAGLKFAESLRLDRGPRWQRDFREADPCR
ncbi:hypothetical protein [Bradyrhizobium brasilense]|uniref:hypothetical protein n=1 Tax=Bradyrhizobium brasilense TaxID=1419277 RepID=UPI001E30D8DC|nr:hypothetical protein [Bradyrhizobium brasilense]MCC8969424.1 hypothetical protein [Bradyrhizobium brasilense]